MPKLRVLDLSYCGLHALPALASASLSSLVLSWNRRLRDVTPEQWPEWGASMSNLRGLDLRFCGLPSLPPMPDSLTHLDLWGGEEIRCQGWKVPTCLRRLKARVVPDYEEELGWHNHPLLEWEGGPDLQERRSERRFAFVIGLRVEGTAIHRQWELGTLGEVQVMRVVFDLLQGRL